MNTKPDFPNFSPVKALDLLDEAINALLLVNYASTALGDSQERAAIHHGIVQVNERVQEVYDMLGALEAAS